MRILVDENAFIPEDAYEIMEYARDYLGVDVPKWNRGVPLTKEDIVYSNNNVYGKNVANNTAELATLLHEKIYDNCEYGYELGPNGEKEFVNPIFAYCEILKMIEQKEKGVVVYGSNDKEITYRIHDGKVDRNVNEMEESHIQNNTNPKSEDETRKSVNATEKPVYACYISQEEWLKQENQQLISDIFNYYNAYGVELRFYFGKENLYEMATKLHYDMYGRSCDETRMEILNETTYMVPEPFSAIAKAYENPGHEFVYENENGKCTGIVRGYEGLRREILTKPDRQARENAWETYQVEKEIEQNHNNQYIER